MATTPLLFFSVSAAVLGMFQFGFNTGVFNAPQEFIEAFIRESYGVDENTASTLFSVAVSLFAVGGMIGCPLGSWLAEKCGRRNALLINCGFGVVSGALMGFSRMADSFEMLAIGRFIVGINCGFATTIAPTYVSEVAPVSLRGGFGTVNQLAVTIGLTISQVLGIDAALGTADNWPTLLALVVIAPTIQIICLPFCPETPSYLLITGKDEERARNELTKLRGDDSIEDEIQEIHAEAQAQLAAGKTSLKSLLTTAQFRAPLMIGVVMHLSQQLGGINAVLYYSTSIFTTVGLAEPTARLATIGVGSVLALMTLVTVPLMDRAGRRTLHLVGLGGMFIFSILMTVALYTSDNSTMRVFAVIFTLGYVASFATGPGSIPWMIMSELFGQGERGAAMGIGALVNWLANFAIGLFFLPMSNALNNNTFLPFTVLILLFFIFTYFKLPETKNRTIEEITGLFKR